MAYPIKEKLLEIPIFKEQDDSVVNWLLEKSEYRFEKAGSYLFKKGDTIDYMLIVLEGEITFMIEAGGNFLPAGSASNGDITGLLPFSRMKEAGGHSSITLDSHIIALHKDYFQELESISPSLVQKLVGLMSDRVRSFTMRQQQREKMEALGKMSAGIAHELNNPASAIRSTSRELNKTWKSLNEVTYDLMASGLDFQTIQLAKGLLQSCDVSTIRNLSIVEKSNLEDEIIDYLDELGFEDSVDLAENLISHGFKPEALQKIEELIERDRLENFLKWFVLTSTLGDMITEIHDASERISNLVASIKTHSHMDRSPDLSEVDLQKGIESTLVIFQHKIKEKRIKIDLNFDKNRPKIMGMEGELNQVWTNLIDNAIDALNENGELKINLSDKDDSVKVCIADNGPGISKDIIGQIFDPFFTTKDLGKGSGLGLDISNRIIKEHNGKIEVNSNPGKTEFIVTIPKQKNG